ncbi:DNA-binding transcriptional regulator, AcrR family [Fontibacillus panacisegetis]|uniref:DNA-binding transcriptional regulator, AcrR family n=1 Tax=Fontibacillus panacisegetis TaxID=670482 RepID=A0A1G7VDA7_9BACL|nr:TetR family transcriptional regulator [Fontibacillus panacisegetis]SDG57723.1 DNA-binding transcriptional regulator, AcrR family [Fontibacillus panacisegetis]
MGLNDTDVKTRILLSAKRLFAKQGYEGTSVRQICEEANANIALVSYHFGGKEKVFEAIFEQFYPGSEEAFNQYEDELKNPVEGLTLIVREIVAFTINDKELSDIIQQELTLQSPRMETVQASLSPVWFKVKELLERGKEEGVFHFDSLTVAFLTVMGVTLSHKRFHSVNVWLKNHDGFIPDSYPDQAARFVLQGLGVKLNS